MIISVFLEQFQNFRERENKQSVKGFKSQTTWNVRTKQTKRILSVCFTIEEVWDKEKREVNRRMNFFFSIVFFYIFQYEWLCQLSLHLWFRCLVLRSREVFFRELLQSNVFSVMIRIGWVKGKMQTSSSEKKRDFFCCCSEFNTQTLFFGTQKIVG